VEISSKINLISGNNTERPFCAEHGSELLERCEGEHKVVLGALNEHHGVV
jgi:hypothetical protein